MSARCPARVNIVSHDRPHPASGAWLVFALLVYGLAGCASAAISPSPTDSATPAAFTSEEFGSPLTIPLPEGWVARETREAVVLSSPPESGVAAERLVIFRTEGGSIEVEVLAGFDTSGADEGQPIAQPWPQDFPAWLEELDMFEVLDQEQGTVGGSAVTIFDVRSDYEPPSGREDMTSLRIILVGAAHEGTDVTVHAEEMRWRFVLFDDRDIAMVYGAVANDFSEDRFQLFVDSLAFGDQPSPT